MTFLMFLGNSRSGTTLIGSLLDAHPNIVIGLKLDALKYVGELDRNELFCKIIEKSKNFSKSNCLDNGYSYRVNNSCQGQFDSRSLKVLGDCAAGTSSILLRKNPSLVNNVLSLADDVRFLHMVRNPFDTIATVYRKTRNKERLNFTLETAVRDVFSAYKVVHDLRDRLTLYTLYFEDFLDNPAKELLAICKFLGTDCSQRYLNSSVKIVNQKPHKSSLEIKWPKQVVENINSEMKKFSFLKRYDSLTNG